jgi:predicted transcriptional regulator
MPSSHTLTIRVKAETKDKLERLAKLTQRTRSWHAADALDAYVDRELRIAEAVREGLEDLETGQLVPHEDVAAEARAIIDAARRRRAS